MFYNIWNCFFLKGIWVATPHKQRKLYRWLPASEKKLKIVGNFSDLKLCFLSIRNYFIYVGDIFTCLTKGSKKRFRLWNIVARVNVISIKTIVISVKKCIILSLLFKFQVAVGVGLILNSRYDVNDEKEICKADKINNLTVLGIFLITIVNVFITSFSVATPQGAPGFSQFTSLPANSTL